MFREKGPVSLGTICKTDGILHHLESLKHPKYDISVVFNFQCVPYYRWCRMSSFHGKKPG